MRAHPWMPTSPCGPSCLDTARKVGMFTVIVRAIGLLGAIAAAALHRTSPSKRCVRVLRACGARLVVHGELPPSGRGALVASNHISWLDILAVNAVTPMRALAKAEIASWPVIGGLIARAGTIFVDRERLSTLPATVAELAAALRAGALVNVSAEGTTWCGAASGRFVPAPFQAAIDGGVPVRPVALRYRLAGSTETTRPAFLGPDSLLASVRRVLRLRGLVVEVFICDEIAPGRARDRRELARLTEAAVHSALGRDVVAPVGRDVPVPVR